MIIVIVADVIVGMDGYIVVWKENSMGGDKSMLSPQGLLCHSWDTQDVPGRV